MNIEEDTPQDAALKEQPHWGELEDEDVAEVWSAAGSDIEEAEEKQKAERERQEAPVGLGADIDIDADTSTIEGIDERDQDDYEMIPLQKPKSSKHKQKGNESD